MDQARWVTTASRVLRVYAAYSRPPAVLSHLAQFIVKVYALCWFTIKKKPQATQGPHHLHLMIAASRFLPKKWRDVVHESISINGFFAHPENLLLAMVTDARKDVRELAVERIVEARQRSPGRRIRSFVVPRINFDAQEYSQLVFWDSVTVTPPPLLSAHSDDDLRAAAAAGPLEVPPLPCHTQGSREARFLSEFGAGSVKQTVFNILAKLLSNEVRIRYNLKGNNRNGVPSIKLRFKDTVPYLVLRAAVKMQCDHLKKQDKSVSFKIETFDKAVSDWLKDCKKRLTNHQIKEKRDEKRARKTLAEETGDNID
ncbi:Methylsterol monooxygenase 1-3 [Frankliniella fusca]|uniref:Methylsterol monooxygenase 1-3 n=1 Tax=Frankliniella fusca TaxID=407009 RepID=A0AAE1HKH8_9NEOP|nr:Methylsterol monooxygenase 1-3 [Frankliniella fusca]